MGRLIALCLIVAVVWAAAELYTKGVDGAFGGALASSESLQHAESRSQRAANAFQRGYDASGNRVDRALGDETE